MGDAKRTDEIHSVLGSNGLANTLRLYPSFKKMWLSLDWFRRSTDGTGQLLKAVDSNPAWSPPEATKADSITQL